MFQASQHRPLSRAWVSMLMVLRVLSLVLGLQLSGVSHFVEDVVSVVATGYAEHDEQCPADGACNDCPPGCPQCHCPNALRSVAAHAPATVVLGLEVSTSLALGGGERAPLAPEIAAPFRPPRTELVS